jgi:ligand-binding SRPBCC domain-containing protein
MIIRRFEVDEDQMGDIGRRSREIVENDYPEIVWEHSHVVVDDSGTVITYCVYEAPNLETVQAHGKALGRHKLEAVHEIVGDVTPADFPPV